MKDIYEIRGDTEGPVSVIMAGVHGDEICGVIAINEIKESLKIEKGTLFLLFGNPRAIDQKVRYTETNLNRMFVSDSEIKENEINSYEYNRAQFIKKYLEESDFLLDLHASYTPKSEPFIICESNAKKIIKGMPASIVVSGFDECEPGGTDYYMNKIGKIGICLECGYLDDSNSISIAREGIETFLKNVGHISGKVKKIKQKHIRIYELYKAKSNRFTLSKPFADFDIIKTGGVIGIDGIDKKIVEKDSVILFARNTNARDEEVCLLGEYKSDLV